MWAEKQLLLQALSQVVTGFYSLTPLALPSVLHLCTVAELTQPCRFRAEQ